MKTLVLGCNGQLGAALSETAPLSALVVGLDLPDLDITDAAAVVEACRRLRPELIVNAAAFTAVDRAESEPALARAVNVHGSCNVAVAARSVGARLIHISTDFVFDGEGSRPYTPGSEPNPLSIYGQTKRDGELAVLDIESESTVVVRTAWLYSKTGKNFVMTMLRLMTERSELAVVADQVSTPTWANSLATAVWEIAGTSDLAGVHHWTDGGIASWHDFAVAIQEEALSLGLLKRGIPIHAVATEVRGGFG